MRDHLSEALDQAMRACKLDHRIYQICEQRRRAMTKRYYGMEGLRQARADAKARGDTEEADKIRNFALELKRLGLDTEETKGGRS